jgi:hypothetical protein
MLASAPCLLPCSAASLCVHALPLRLPMLAPASRVRVGTCLSLLLQTPELSAAQIADFPKLLERNDPATMLYGNDTCLAVALPVPVPHLQTVAQRARRAAVEAAEEWLKTNGTVPTCINLDTGHLFFRVPVSRWELLLNPSLRRACAVSHACAPLTLPLCSSPWLQ